MSTRVPQSLYAPWEIDQQQRSIQIQCKQALSVGSNNGALAR
jgi:hypothetical protein